MGRLAAGLLCALRLTRDVSQAATPEDTTLLVQVRHVQDDTERSMQPAWEVMDGLPTVGYTFEKYKAAEYVEGKARDGSWMPCIITETVAGRRYNVHVSDSFPGYDLPNVPWQLLRRPLVNGTSDFYVDNSKLQHHGHGLKYRHSKNLVDTSEEYVPWGALVVGHDEGDGWVRTATGYLPYVIHGNQVLRQVDREKTNTFPTFERFLQRLKANFTTPAPSVNAVETTPPVEPATLTFEAGEVGEFRTKGKGWQSMQVRGPGSIPGTYNIVVRPTDFAVYPVNNVRMERLRKVKKYQRIPKEGEAPACRKDGCYTITVRLPNVTTADVANITVAAANRTNRTLRLPRDLKFTLQVALHGRLDMLMRMVCNKMRIKWEECQKRATFKLRGNELSPLTFVTESELRDQDVVDMELIPSLVQQEDEKAAVEELMQQSGVFEESTEEPGQVEEPAEETA